MGVEAEAKMVVDRVVVMAVMAEDQTGTTANVTRTVLVTNLGLVGARAIF